MWPLDRLTPRARKLLDWVVGTALILIGIVGLFVPILQGLALILLGLAVLGSHSRWAKMVNDRLKRFGRGIREKISPRHGEGD